MDFKLISRTTELVDGELQSLLVSEPNSGELNFIKLLFLFMLA